MGKLTFKKNIDGIDYYIYKPSVLQPYDESYPEGQGPDYHSRLPHRIRMLLNKFMYGYIVVYMKVDGVTVGHLVVTRGGHVEGSSRRDIIIGPTWTAPAARGKGYGAAGIDAVLNRLDIPYESMYGYISADNIPSIRAGEKNGYQMIFKGREQGRLKKIVQDPNGGYNVYTYKRKK